MPTEIIVAMITGGLALLGVVFSTRSSERRTQDSIRTAQAVDVYKRQPFISSTEPVL